jgi:hypothetical protein
MLARDGRDDERNFAGVLREGLLHRLTLDGLGCLLGFCDLVAAEWLFHTLFGDSHP